VQRAWFVAFPPETLLQEDPLGSEVTRIASPAGERLAVVSIWLCAPEVGRRPEFPLPPSPLRLSDGRLAWVGHEAQPYERAATPPARPVVGTMVEFSYPEPGETPGFVIRTVDVA
jgi:hypothetical protein